MAPAKVWRAGRRSAAEPRVLETEWFVAVDPVANAHTFWL